MEHYDILIIGGGAAGITAAVYLKKQKPDVSVRILESQARVGKKLSLTGNGRCNLSNASVSEDNYFSSCPDFVKKILTVAAQLGIFTQISSY